jgi:hypothetical protein
MARGWESKSVEEQQTGELDRRAFQNKPQTHLDAERSSLKLQRKRIEALIASSTNPRYIDQQQKALIFLDDKLRAILLPESGI